jgi:hypothetical protein
MRTPGTVPSHRLYNVANVDGIIFLSRFSTVVPTPAVIDDYGFLFSISRRDGPVWVVGYQGLGFGEPNDLIFNWTR